MYYSFTKSQKSPRQSLCRYLLSLSNETFAKLYKTSNYVIPANTLKGTRAGIQYYQVFPGFRVTQHSPGHEPGMTNSGVVQRSRDV
jgi:hypothetical protein